MKKIIGVFLAVSLLAVLFSGCELFPAKKVTFYSADGETKTVSVKEAEKYKGSKKWYSEPVQTLYSEDEEKVFKKSEVKEKLGQGWFKTPVVRMYSEDGKSELVEEADVKKYEDAGWYSGEPVVLYDENGNEKTVGENDAELYIKNGWSKVKPQDESPVYAQPQEEMSSSKAGFKLRYDELSARIYSADYSHYTFEDWDQLLNEIYYYLKTTMSSDEFSALQQDEYNWITEKENAIAQQSDTYKDSVAISYTRSRCEYLLSLVK